METTQLNVSVTTEFAALIRRAAVSRHEMGSIVQRAVRLYLEKLQQLEESYREEKCTSTC
jgi:hypothetical protein